MRVEEDFKAFNTECYNVVKC